ncbi:recombinase family protein [Streptomyces sirii]|uniref:recombinase family protein n=1 Tax=Streptomyces sirii TaxID=3127701 RepID=UPI003D36DCC0
MGIGLDIAIDTAAVYARQSKERKDKSAASTITQLEAGTETATRMGAARVREYEDKGRSGYDPNAVREDFERMLTDARAGQINAIVVYDVSRFSRRELKDAVPLVFELHALGITLISVTEGVFPPNDTMALIMLIVRLDQANKDSAIKSKKIKATKAKLRDAGGFVGGLPTYGLDVETVHEGGLTLRRFVVNQKEARIIRGIVSTILFFADKEPERRGRRFEGSLSAIAEHLNEREVPTKRAEFFSKRTKWSIQTLKRMLRNPALMGYAADAQYVEVPTKNGGTRKAFAGWRIRRDEEGRPIVTHEAIIPPEDWYAVQKWLDTRDRGRGIAKKDWVLSGQRLLYCQCPYSMTSGGSKGSNGVRSYKCSKPAGITVPEHEGGSTIHKDHLEAFVGLSVLSRLEAADPTDEEDAVWLAEASRRFAEQAARPEATQERKSLLAEKADYKAEEKFMFDDLDAGLYRSEMGRERFKEKHEKITAQLVRVEARLMELGASAGVGLPMNSWLERDDPESDDLIGPGSWWAKADVEEKRAMLRILVDRITVRKADSKGGDNTGPYDPSTRVTIAWAKPKNAKEPAEHALTA